MERKDPNTKGRHASKLKTLRMQGTVPASRVVLKSKVQAF